MNSSGESCHTRTRRGTRWVFILKIIAGRVIKTHPNKNKNKNNIFDHQPTTAFRNGSIQLYHKSGGVTPLQDSPAIYCQVGSTGDFHRPTAGKTARSLFETPFEKWCSLETIPASFFVVLWPLFRGVWFVSGRFFPPKIGWKWKMGSWKMSLVSESLEDHSRTCKWLGSPPFISHEFSPFGRGATPVRGLTNHSY